MADFDVWIGGQSVATLDWRADKSSRADDADDDAPLKDTPTDVIGILGFDPAESEVTDTAALWDACMPETAARPKRHDISPHRKDLYYVQPDGTFKKGGDGRSEGLTKDELPADAEISRVHAAEAAFATTLKSLVGLTAREAAAVTQLYLRRGLATLDPVAGLVVPTNSLVLHHKIIREAAAAVETAAATVQPSLVSLVERVISYVAANCPTPPPEYYVVDLGTVLGDPSFNGYNLRLTHARPKTGGLGLKHGLKLNGLYNGFREWTTRNGVRTLTDQGGTLDIYMRDTPITPNVFEDGGRAGTLAHEMVHLIQDRDGRLTNQPRVDYFARVDEVEAHAADVLTGLLRMMVFVKGAAPTAADLYDSVELAMQQLKPRTLAQVKKRPALQRLIAGMLKDWLPQFDASWKPDRPGVSYPNLQAAVTAMRSGGLSSLAPTETETAGAVAPRSLYVHRDVLNHEEIAKFYEAQGLPKIDSVKLHTTVAYSKAEVDWMSIAQDPRQDVIVPPGGPRMMTVFGEGALVLLYNSPDLSSRWQEFRDAGCSWDFPEYQSHVTIAYLKPETSRIDPAKIKPWQGIIVLGPEMWDIVDPPPVEERANTETAAGPPGGRRGGPRSMAGAVRGGTPAKPAVKPVAKLTPAQEDMLTEYVHSDQHAGDTKRLAKIWPQLPKVAAPITAYRYALFNPTEFAAVKAKDFAYKPAGGVWSWAKSVRGAEEWRDSMLETDPRWGNEWKDGVYAVLYKSTVHDYFNFDDHDLDLIDEDEILANSAAVSRANVVGAVFVGRNQRPKPVDLDTLAPTATKSANPTAAYAIGDAIKVKAADGKLYPATVQKVKGKQVFVTWGGKHWDSEPSWVHTDHVQGTKTGTAKPAVVVKPAPTASEPVPVTNAVAARAEIERVYLELTKGQFAQGVSLDKLRDRAQLTREQFDAALREILKGDKGQAHRASLGQYSDPKSITPAIKAAAFSPAGEPSHLLRIASTARPFEVVPTEQPASGGTVGMASRDIPLADRGYIIDENGKAYPIQKLHGHMYWVAQAGTNKTEMQLIIDDGWVFMSKADDGGRDDLISANYCPETATKPALMTAARCFTLFKDAKVNITHIDSDENEEYVLVAAPNRRGYQMLMDAAKAAAMPAVKTYMDKIIYVLTQATYDKKRKQFIQYPNDSDIKRMNASLEQLGMKRGPGLTWTNQAEHIQLTLEQVSKYRYNVKFTAI